MCVCGYLVATVCLIIIGTVHAQTGKSCTTPNGESGRCKSIYDCRILLDTIRNHNSEQLNFMRQSQCGYDRNPLVCCGTKNNFATSTTQRSTTNRRARPTNRNQQTSRSNVIPDRTSCGFQVSDRIFGGEETGMDEFPWMALLEYNNDANKKRFACGGAVIAKRYILTAAHCVTGDILQKLGKLVNVRLGEWDTRQEIDCITNVGIKICNKPPEDFEVEETMYHSDYDPRSSNRYADIALVRVKRDIKYTDFIRPICLPLAGESSAIGDNLFVAGWGKTESANQNPIKLKLKVPVAERSQCSSKFRSAGITLKDSQICAGGKKGKDSCTGDSGGPLMRTTKNDSSQWYVEGLVSFGTKCGSEGWPGVYTKVYEYIDWIYENVKE